MRFDTRTALVMRRAARGPAAIALRQQRILKPLAVKGNPTSAVIQSGLAGPARMTVPGLYFPVGQGPRYQTFGQLPPYFMIGQGPRYQQFSVRNSLPVNLGRLTRAQAGARLVGGGVGSAAMGASRLVSAGTGGVPGGLTGFGQASTTSAIESAAAGAGARYGATVGAASLATTFGVAGSVVPIIGTAVGIVVGILASKAFAKNYLSVANINVAEDDEVSAFNQYRGVAGKFAGRQVGVPAMRAVWLGSQHEGMFPFAANAPRQCFHNGCLKYGGRPDWVDSVLNHYGGDNNPAPNTFPDLFKLWKSHAPVPGAGATNSSYVVPGNTAQPAVVVRSTAPVRSRVVALMGLGQVSNQSAAVDFIDNYFIPANRVHSTPPWAVPSTALEHQILYDMADAWLATQPIQTSAFVAIAPSAPAPLTVPQPVNIAPATSGGGAVTTQYPGYQMFNPTGYNGQPLYVAVADASKTNQNIPTYAVINGQMTVVGSLWNAGANVQPMPLIPPPTGAGGAPVNTYPLVPVTGPGGGTTYQPAPAPGAAPAAPAAAGLSLGPIIALAAGALTLMR
jgi:hypothetical protein